MLIGFVTHNVTPGTVQYGLVRKEENLFVCGGCQLSELYLQVIVTVDTEVHFR